MIIINTLYVIVFPACESYKLNTFSFFLFILLIKYLRVSKNHIITRLPLLLMHSCKK